MTPNDVLNVQRSWTLLHARRGALLAALTERFECAAPTGIPAELRAGWLFDAVEELVGLLNIPSRLAECACDIGITWPDPLTAPSFAIDGRAWLSAASDCSASWTDSTDAAWRQAWLLLSDVLAAETLSPFADAEPPCQKKPARTLNPTPDD